MLFRCEHLLAAVAVFILLSGCAQKPESMQAFPLPDAEAWSMGYRAQNENKFIAKYVRFNETIRTWHDLISVTKLYHSKDLTFSEVMKNTLATLRKACPYEVRETLLVSNETHLIFKLDIADDDRIWEQSYWKIFRGKRDIWLVQYATKKTPVIDVREAAILRYLKGIVWDQ